MYEHVTSAHRRLITILRASTIPLLFQHINNDYHPTPLLGFHKHIICGITSMSLWVSQTSNIYQASRPFYSRIKIGEKNRLVQLDM